MKIVPNLTSLRFVLASLVVFYHIPQFCQNRGFPFFNDFPIFNKGEEAVYVFFSLSGFLIIRQLFLEKSITNTINLKNFFLRRVLRIFPLYYLILTFGLFYYRWILPHFGFNYESNYNLVSGIFLSYTFFPNIFALDKPGGIIEVLWSIGIEEQFYMLIAPIIFLLPFRRIIQFLLFFTIVYFLLYFSEALLFLKKYQMLFFYFSFSGLCSLVIMNEKWNGKLQKIRYLVLGIFVIYFTTFFFKDNFTPTAYHFFSMILFGITIGSLAGKPIIILENKQFNYLGKISYGIYMYHAIVMQIIGFIYLKWNVHLKLSSVSSIILFNLLVLIVTIIASHFSYKYYESYFLNWKKKLGNKEMDEKNRLQF